MKLVFRRSAGHDLEDAARFPVVDYGVRRGLVKSFPYAIYFLIDEGAIIVLGVLHQHRKSGVWLRRL